MTIKSSIPSKLREYMNSVNIAEELSPTKLTEIGDCVIEKAQLDDESRYEWKKTYRESLKIAMQYIEKKNTPWPNASNVKYPLVLTACIQFNARTNPEIVQGEKVVHVATMLSEPSDDEEERADRLSEHMSYQLLGQSENWRSDTDKLLITLPLVGVVYRKTYFDAIDKKPQIDFCLPSDIIVHNEIESLERAPRITHVLHLSDNELWERMKAGLYREVPIEELEKPEPGPSSYDSHINSVPEDIKEIEGMHTVYEQHTRWDLDDDGYAEPYIITVHKQTQEVLRIVARYDEDCFVYKDNSGEFVKINAINYFTDYHFIPSPDGTFHSLGFGQILYPMNEVVNSTINQLLDAGALSNRGGGFIAKSLRMRKENIRFKLGEYIQIDTPTGTNISQNIFPMPVKEPSAALFSLLEFLVKAGQEISSVSDIMLGQPPAPNTPATTVVSMVEQGSKVFSSMLNRLYYSFKKEFEKLFELNKKYLDQYETYEYALKIGEVTLDDYRQDSYGVFPVSDPHVSSDAQRIAKAQALMQMLQMPGVDVHEILERYLKALKITNIQKILPPEPTPEEQAQQPPSPQEMMAESEIRLKNMQASDLLMKRELEAIRLDIEERRLQLDAATQGVKATSDKIDAVSKMAITDAEVGAKQVEQAEKQVQTLQVPTQQDFSDLHDRLGNIENMLQNAGSPSAQTPETHGQDGQENLPSTSEGELAPNEQPEEFEKK